MRRLRFTIEMVKNMKLAYFLLISLIGATGSGWAASWSLWTNLGTGDVGSYGNVRQYALRVINVEGTPTVFGCYDTGVASAGVPSKVFKTSAPGPPTIINM